MNISQIIGELLWVKTRKNYLLILLLIIFFSLFMAVLGLRFCARAFSICGKRGPLFIAVRGPLTIAASLVAEHRLQMRRLSSCGSRAQLHHGMWDLPIAGLEPVSPSIGRQILNHCATREALLFFDEVKLSLFLSAFVPQICKQLLWASIPHCFSNVVNAERV